MRDAMGGSVVIVIIVFFIVAVSAYLAFNVNYTKAFRMKNKIISYYEEYKGDCYNVGSTCHRKIKKYADEIGYDPADLNCDSLGKCTGSRGRTKDCYKEIGRLYCVKKVEKNKLDDPTLYVHDDTGGSSFYYKIVTKIDIKIPILNNVFGKLQVFQITGDTKVIETKY